MLNLSTHNHSFACGIGFSQPFGKNSNSAHKPMVQTYVFSKAYQSLKPWSLSPRSLELLDVRLQADDRLSLS